MPRAPRRQQWADAACYHVMNRGHNRETVFADDEDRRYFLGLLARYRERFSLRLYHYCLMSNHFHLLLQLPDPRRLSALGAGLLRAYVHYFNRRYGFVGHLWQARFKSPAVEVEAYFLSCGRYIERNPLAAGMVPQPWDYSWSSCRHYARGEADALLSANPWYEALSADSVRRQERWREFLLGEDAKEEVVRQSDWVIGGGDFRRRQQRPQGRALPRRPSRPDRASASTEGYFPQLLDP